MREKVELTKWRKLLKIADNDRLTSAIASRVTQINGKHCWKIIDQRAKPLQLHLDLKLDLAKVHRVLLPPQNCCTVCVNAVAAQALIPHSVNLREFC